MDVMINRQSGESLYMASGNIIDGVDAYDKFTLELLESSLQSFEPKEKQILKPRQFVMDYQESFDKTTLQSSHLPQSRSNSEWKKSEQRTKKEKIPTSLTPMLRRFSTREDHRRTFDPVMTKPGTSFRQKTPLATSTGRHTALLQMSPGTRTEGERDGTSTRRRRRKDDRAKKNLLAKVIQADKNIQLNVTSSTLDQVDTIAQQQQHPWKARKSVNPTNEKLVKSEFTTQTNKQLPSRTTNGTLIEPPLQKQDVKEAALRVIKSHKKQQLLRVKTSVISHPQRKIWGQNADISQEASTIDELQLKQRSNTAEDKEENKMKLDDSKRNITFDTRQSESIYHRPWKINFDNERVRRVSNEHFQTSFAVDKRLNLTTAADDKIKSRDSRKRGADIKTIREAILADLKQTLVNCLQPEDTADSLNQSHHQKRSQSKTAQAYQSPRFNNELEINRDRGSILTNATTNLQATTRMQERNASSLSPSQQRIATNHSSFFQESKTNHNESTKNTVIERLQKATLSGSNSVEIPKMPAKYSSIAVYQHQQNTTAVTEQSQRNDSVTDQNNSFEMTLGSRRLQDMTNQIKAAGDQLMINENFSQGVASSASSYNDQSIYSIQKRPRINTTHFQQNEPIQDELKIAENSSFNDGDDTQRSKNGPPILTELPMFESIFSVQKSDLDDVSEQETPNLPHELYGNSFGYSVAHPSKKQHTTKEHPVADDYEPQSKTQFLPFTKRHRSTLKGQAKVPTELLFLKDSGKGEHQMRIKCSDTAKSHRAFMKDLIAKLDSEVKSHLNYLHSKEVEKQIETAIGPVLPLRTKFELESTLFHRFDVHKKDRNSHKQPDPSWEYELDDFLEREKVKGVNHRLATYWAKDLSKSDLVETLDLPQFNKAGNVEKQDWIINDVNSLKDAKLQMTAFYDPVCHESELPIQVLYNQKIERIRVLEYEKQSAPLPIKFDISDSYTGIPSQKMIKIISDSAPKDYTFDIDLADKSNQRIYETQLEQFTRNKRFKKEVIVQLTDFTKGQKDNKGVADFIAALHNKVAEQALNRTFTKKMYAKQKSPEQIHAKLTRKVIGLRRGKQFDFVKIDRPEYDDKNVKKQTPLLFDTIKEVMPTKQFNRNHEVSSENFASEISSVASLDSGGLGASNNCNDQTNQIQPLLGPGIKPATSQAYSRTQRHLQTSQKKEQKAQDNDDLSIKTNSDYGQTEQQSVNTNLTATASKKLSFNLKRGKILKIGSTEESRRTIDKMETEDKSRHTIKELTVAQDYESKYDQLKEQRAQRFQQTKEVSKYEGVIPVHQRLVLLCHDFLESTRDFDQNDLFNFQSVIQGFETSMKAEKADKLKRLVKELFKKYQIEVLQPNLEFVVNKFKTAHEKLKNTQDTEAETEKDQQSHQFVQKPLSKELLKFHFATYDKREKSPQIIKSPLLDRIATQKITQNPSARSRNQSIMTGATGSSVLPKHRTVALSQLNEKRNSIFGQQYQKPTPTLSTLKRRKQTSYFAQKRLTTQNNDKAVLVNDSSDNSFSGLDTDRQAKIDDDLAAQDEGKWFKMLDWQDNEKLAHFGHNRDLNHTVALSDLKPLTVDHQTPIITRSRNAGKSSILGSLVEDSYRTFEKGFDQTQLRQQITLQKSMFKQDIRIKDVFQNPKWLKNVISGADQDEIDKSQLSHNTRF